MRIYTMRGIEIRPVEFPWGAGKPSDARPFEVFFHPILSALARFHWVYTDDLPFQNEPGNHAFGDLCERWLAGYFPPDTLLPRYAHHVTNDWFDLFGVLQPPTPDIQRRLRSVRTNSTWISGVVDLCIFNVDGAYWEFYARDNQMLETVAGNVAQLNGVDIAEKRLEDRNPGL